MLYRRADFIAIICGLTLFSGHSRGVGAAVEGDTTAAQPKSGAGSFVCSDSVEDATWTYTFEDARNPVDPGANQFELGSIEIFDRNLFLANKAAVPLHLIQVDHAFISGFIEVSHGLAKDSVKDIAAYSDLLETTLQNYHFSLFSNSHDLATSPLEVRNDKGLVQGENGGIVTASHILVTADQSFKKIRWLVAFSGSHLRQDLFNQRVLLHLERYFTFDQCGFKP